MRATKYFQTKDAMTGFAKEFRDKHPLNWHLRTTFECDHKVNERRKAILLIKNEHVFQKLIYCRICNVHGNAIEKEGGTTNE